MTSKLELEGKTLKFALENFRFNVDKYKDKDNVTGFYKAFPITVQLFL